MYWVGVRYRGIALADYESDAGMAEPARVPANDFDFVISGSGTLVRAQFAQEAEAADFAEAFAGFASPDRPSERGENERSREGAREAQTRP